MLAIACPAQRALQERAALSCALQLLLTAPASWGTEGVVCALLPSMLPNISPATAAASWLECDVWRGGRVRQREPPAPACAGGVDDIAGDLLAMLAGQVTTPDTCVGPALTAAAHEAGRN
jgi:hypothetical protein